MATQNGADPLAVIRRGKPGSLQTLDLSKQAHWSFINEQYARAGATKKNSPKLFGALAAARRHGAGPQPKAAPPGTLVPLNAIVSLGFTSDGTYATAFSAIPGGTLFTMAILELVDPSSGTVLGTATVSEFGVGEYLPIRVTAARPEGNEIEAIFTVSYQTGAGKPINQSMRMVVSDNADGAPSVRAPERKTRDRRDIRIALGAWHSQPGYDYWYRSLHPRHPDLRLPLVGTQRYRSPIARPFDPDLSLYLIAPTRGGVAMATTKSIAALRKRLQVAGNKLTWNMPWSANPLADRSIDFGNAAWGEQRVLLVFTIDVLTKTATAPVRTAVCSALSTDAQGDDPGAQTIPPISYFWR